MTITRDQYRQAYERGKRVSAGRLRITDARKELVEFGINPNSATDMVYNVGHMLHGRTYKRALSTAATRDYLDWIHEDYGDRGLASSLNALMGHIEYYQELRGAEMATMRAVYSEYSSRLGSKLDFVVYPDEEDVTEGHSEGGARRITVDVRERSRPERDKCIRLFGARCIVCEFDFQQVYGEIGEGFIHVHHLRALSKAESVYQVIAERDLRPVCPNCHAMLHRGQQLLSIEELQAIISKNKKANKAQHPIADSS